MNRIPYGIKKAPMQEGSIGAKGRKSFYLPVD
jgi:hypothetical protein